MRGDGPDWLDPEHGYTFLVLAAHEARKASRRYWAPGGPADRKYPVREDPHPPEDPSVGHDDLVDRRSRRRGGR